MASGRLRLHHHCAQEGEHRRPDPVGVAMSVLTQLGIAGPVPLVLNAPALPDQAQKGLWGGADAGEEPVPPRHALPLSCRRRGDHLHDPGTAGPVGLDVLWCLPGLELPGGVAAVLLLLIRCRERDRTLSLELAADLAVEGFLVGFDGQEHVGPLLQAPLKNGRVVCRASAWIRTPSSFRVLSSCLRAARSLDSPVS